MDYKITPQQTLFNDRWSFSHHPLDTPKETVLSTADWQPVPIPHDWLIYDTNHLSRDGQGWYKKTFSLAEFSPETDTYLLYFDGVYMDSTVYVNRQPVGQWKYGYTSFYFDISPYLTAGDNEILVQVNYQAPNSRWYSGAGIYRNVWLISTEKEYLVPDGVYIANAPVAEDPEQWSTHITTEIAYGPSPAKDLSLQQTLWLGDQKIAETTTPVALPTTPAEGCPHTVEQELLIKNPALWDTEAPVVYRLETTLLSHHRPIHTVNNSTGFRTVAFCPDSGFLLNGKRIELQGTCEHHDLGALGAAMNRTALRRQLETLQDMGVNAIRTAHNPPAKELMDLADEMGLLICSESFDIWRSSKTTYDYARFFDQWAEKDMAHWVRRDRNHPSLVLWSIGNEIVDTHASLEGVKTTRWLKELVEQHDPKGNGKPTFGSNYLLWENTQVAAEELKIVGYNYAEALYPKHHEKYPQWVLYGSETASVVQSRGIYHFPLSQSVLADDDQQCSALGNSTTSWGAKSAEQCIIDHRDAPYTMGQFIWTGCDYIGEPTPYHTKNSYFGQIDTAGFPKDSFYTYQSAWTDYRQRPMVHILPYWDFSPGQAIDVRVLSNAPTVELFLNDTSLGKQNIDHAHGTVLSAHWQVPYTQGTLKAIAYAPDGTPIATQSKRSFGESHGIRLLPDKESLSADGNDLLFITLQTEDIDGIPVENANNRITVSVSGQGHLVGLDNGDSTDYDQYKGTSRRLFSGKLLAIVAPDLTPGEITITAASPGLRSAELTIPVTAAAVPPGTSTTFLPPLPTPEDNTLPVRKIELTAERHSLTKENPSVTIAARRLPENATDNELFWRVTNSAGIDSTIASLAVEGDSVTLTAHSDGEIFVRCGTKNHGETLELYSLLNFTATGLGQATLDPYEFISGGLYSRSNVTLGNGNERGVATLRGEPSHVIFDLVDFGPYGSDTITLPLFPLEGGELPIEVWCGAPGAPDSEKLDTLTYTKGSRWNTYQEQTFVLPRKLQGLVTLSFVLHRKVHIKGFSFAPQQSFLPHSALEYSALYGDSYDKRDDGVYTIGNNVSLVFPQMNFGTQGTDRISITGQTPLDSTMVQIRLSGEKGDTLQIADFKGTPETSTQTFALEHLTGTYDVTFVFLPGSQFDFNSFQFHTKEDTQ